MNLVGGTATDPLRLGALDVGVSEQGLSVGGRQGGLLGALGSLSDLLTDVLLDLLELLLGSDAELDETGLHTGDGVVVRTHVLDLLTGTVGGSGVGHGVATVTVGLVLNNNGTVLQGVLTGELRAAVDSKHVHGVDLQTGDILTTLVELGHGRGAAGGGAHTVLVVLASEDAGDLPELGHVVGLEHLALVGGTVTVKGEGDEGLLVVLVGERQTETKRDLGTDNTVTTEESLGVHVHGATFALGDTGAAAHELSKDGLDGSTTSVLETVAAVRGDDGILLVGGLLDANGDSLLADGQVAETVDLLGLVESVGAHLQTPDRGHLAEDLKELLLAEVDLGLRALLELVERETGGRQSNGDVFVGSTRLGGGTKVVRADGTHGLATDAGGLAGERRAKAQHSCSMSVEVLGVRG